MRASHIYIMITFFTNSVPNLTSNVAESQMVSTGSQPIGSGSILSIGLNWSQLVLNWFSIGSVLASFSRLTWRSNLKGQRFFLAFWIIFNAVSDEVNVRRDFHTTITVFFPDSISLKVRTSSFQFRISRSKNFIWCPNYF